MRLYRRLQFGSLVDFTVLDTRQFRTNQACNGATATACAEADAAARTMLGAEQEQWLFDQLGTVKAKWTVLGQQVPTFARDLAGSNPQGRFSMDKWDGYTVARQRLYERLRETKAPNPVVLSGDVHVHYGADLKRDFHDEASEAIGVELTNSSITSGSDGTEVAGNWEAVRGANPHIKYHSARRGYVACTVSASAMRADFKVLDHVTVPDSPVRIGGSVIVEAGRSALVPS
jgi:alkaline phosphatase D